jgi:hypothetical protein
MTTRELCNHCGHDKGWILKDGEDLTRSFKCADCEKITMLSVEKWVNIICRTLPLIRDLLADMLVTIEEHGDAIDSLRQRASNLECDVSNLR